MIYVANDALDKIPDLSYSNKYYTVVTKLQDGSSNVKFISKDDKCINSELRESLNYYVWADNDNFIYSIENRGIYLYNVTLRKYATIITGSNEKFEIKEYKNNILKYDDKSINLKK